MNVNQKPSEPSILETASLMKTSVFLSPTFVPTVANMISGEVEISNVKNNNDSKRSSESFVLENIRDRSVHCDTTSLKEKYENEYQNSTLELNVVINGIQSVTSNANEIISKESEICKQLDRNYIVEDNSEIRNDYGFNRLSKHLDQSSEFEVNKDFSDLTEIRLNASRSSDIINGTSDLKLNKDSIDTFDTKTNRDVLISSGTEKVKNISLEKNTIQFEDGGTDDNLKSLNIIEIVKNIPVEKNVSQIEGGVNNRLKSFEENEYAVNEVITASNLEDNIMKQDEINKEFSFMNKTAIQTKQTENENMITKTSLKSCDYANNCTEVNIGIVSLEEKIMKINENPNTQSICIEHDQSNMFCSEEIHGSNISLNKLDEIKNDFALGDNIKDKPISFKDISNESKFPKNVSNIISVKDNKIVITENETMPVESFVIQQTEENLFEKEIICLKDDSIQINQSEKDKNANTLNCSKNDRRSLYEQSNIREHISSSLEPAAPLKVIVDNIATFTPDVGENIPYGEGKMKLEKKIEIQECEMPEDLSNVNFKHAITEHFDIPPTDTIADLGVSSNKIVHKINIISEEIIPPLDFKDLRRAHSPIITSLTPVPLNSIIAPRRNNDNFCEMKSVDKGSTLILQQTEVLTSETVSSIFLSSPAQFGSICNMDSTTVYSQEYVETKNNPNNVQVNILENGSTDKENSKNNNDASNSFVIGDLTVEHNEYSECNEVVDMEIDDSFMPDLPILQINNIDGNFMNVENASTNSDNGDMNSKSTSVQQLCLSNFKEVVANKKDSKHLLKKKQKNNKKINETEVMNKCIEDKEFCKNQINHIVKSKEENRNIDKVKEIAECIKKYAHVYKDNKPIINKVFKKKSTINSKSNMTKSKLCIQGVEKPGGNKGGIVVANESKVLKTYTRQKKHNEPCTSKNIIEKSKPVLCNIGDISETELNVINISSSYKSQDYCLCYDFGRLDASAFDKSYEHIHFWLHEETVDLGSILSIYNDEEVIANDRTTLDDVSLYEVIEADTKTSNICWSYFHMNIETPNEMHSINSPVEELNNTINKSVDEIESLGKNSDKESNTVVNIPYDTKGFDSTTNLLEPSADNSYEIITVVEVVDNEIVTLKSDVTDSIVSINLKSLFDALKI